MTDDRFFEVVLVHELVHFLQNFNGTYDEVECQQNLESDAYEVQSHMLILWALTANKTDHYFPPASLCPINGPILRRWVMYFIIASFGNFLPI